MKRSTLPVVLFCLMALQVFAQSDLAPLKVTTNDSPEPGFLYLAPNCRVSPRPYAPYLGVYNVNGGVMKVGRTANYPFEYKVFPDGRLGYSELVVFAGASVPAGVYIVDTLFATQEFVSQARGYLTTQHDFHMLPNGNLVILGAEDVTVDMSKVVPGGHPAANVVQAVIQEIDRDGNVVVQWRSLDHLPITDSYENLQAPAIRYCHNNSLWIDNDGNWIVSMRHMSQVIKVNRATGDVMWILGGKSNQFTFIGEHEEQAPTYFSYQHDARRLPNGHITLFDNGTQHTPQYSRGVEYELDEVNKTCRLVWEYRHVPDYYVSIQGGLQTLANGHRLLGWGSAANEGSAAVTEVDSNGTVVFEASYPKQMYVYRATKYPIWPTGRASATVQIKDVLLNETYSYHRGAQNVGMKVQFTSLDSYFYNTTVAQRAQWSPVNSVWNEEAPLLHQGRISLVVEGVRSHEITVRFNIDTLGIVLDPQKLTVYRRSYPDTGSFLPLNTRYDAATRELVVEKTTAGEFAFGIPAPKPDAPRVPTLQWPIGAERILEKYTHQLRVAQYGRTDSLYVQVARDFAFTMMVQKGSTQSDRIAFNAGNAEEKFYWRARATIGKLQSDWSKVDSFVVAAPFLEINRPETDVRWTHDSSYAVSWKTNITGSVRLELVKDGELVAIVRDSVPASSQGYLWLVPVTVPIGTGYHIRITSREQQFAQIVVTDAENIEITGITSVRDVAVAQPSPLSVYPQPAIDHVTLENIGSGCVSAMVFASTGEQVAEVQGSGVRIDIATSGLTTGVYTAIVSDRLGRTFRSRFVVQR
ncbi:MAG: aryl-sulfate sulfotransferase [Candidatus Kapabacteria bacterium]|nr:aryl-sulfate sulfotransferase [Candidatus Kapabacteria bacterium]